jgi:hypothetical protein
MIASGGLILLLVFPLMPVVMPLMLLMYVGI